MSRKRSQIARGVEPQGADDLKLINGIGPAVVTRLNGVGIFTFAQLAAMSPADLAAAVAGLPGLTAERIIKQDWIGQARELAAQSTSPRPKKDAELTSPTLPVPAVDKRDLAGVLRLSDIEIILGETTGRHGSLSNGQPFGTRLMLDLTDIALPEEEQFRYTAVIYGNRLESRVRLLIGEGHGAIIPADRITIDVDCAAPSQGTYHLEAALTLMQPTTVKGFSDLSTMKKGGLLHVH